MSLKAPNHFQYSFELPSRSSPHARRSAPTQKARPVPVTTTTRISSSHDASSKARASSRSMRKSKAFSTSGRFERDGRPRVVLLVDDPLEAELVGRERTGLVRLRHSVHSTNVTVNGIPISIASLPAAANSSERTAALNASMSAHSNSA